MSTFVVNKHYEDKNNVTARAC